MSRTSWMTDALCDGHPDPNLFFDHERVTEAQAFCSDCPVRDDCLDYAIEANIKHGVFGGKTDDQRQRIRRRRRFGT